MTLFKSYRLPAGGQELDVWYSLGKHQFRLRNHPSKYSYLLFHYASLVIPFQMFKYVGLMSCCNTMSVMIHCNTAVSLKQYMVRFFETVYSGFLWIHKIKAFVIFHHGHKEFSKVIRWNLSCLVLPVAANTSFGFSLLNFSVDSVGEQSTKCR